MAINPISARLIYLEDLSTTTSPTGATASVNVLNAATNPQTLHKIPWFCLPSSRLRPTMGRRLRLESP